MLITGANGMLGKTLKNYFPNAVLLKGKADLDLTNLSDVQQYFNGTHHDVIIHCAAFTNLEYCESNSNLAKILHVDVLNILSKHCNKLIYISTNPNKFDKIYYLTKYEGEMRTLLLNDNNLVIRTNIYGEGGLVDWIITNFKNNKHINGYVNSMFNAIHVQQLSKIIHDTLLNSTGIVNVAGNYKLSKFDFIHLVALQFNLSTNLITPTYLKHPQDLTINNSIYDFSLSEGLGFLKENYYI